MSTVLNDEQVKVAVSENIARLLVERGMTQQQLADSTKENKMTISHLIHGRHVPGLGLISRIADVLHVSVDDLLKKENKKNSRNSKQSA